MTFIICSRTFELCIIVQLFVQSNFGSYLSLFMLGLFRLLHSLGNMCTREASECSLAFCVGFN